MVHQLGDNAGSGFFDYASHVPDEQTAQHAQWLRELDFYDEEIAKVHRISREAASVLRLISMMEPGTSLEHGLQGFEPQVVGTDPANLKAAYEFACRLVHEQVAS